MNQMRKIYSFIALASLATLNAQAQNALPNNSFETWETVNAGIGSYNEPVDWNSANTCSYILSVSSVSQSTDAHSGSSSAKMETKQAGAILIGGVLSTATMVCNPANPGITGGLPYTQRPDSLVGWFKYTPQGVDTAYIQFILFDANGDSVSYTKHKIIGTTTAWTRFSAPISYMNNNAVTTSSFLANSSWGNSNNGEAVVGSILLLDDVELVFATGIDEHALNTRVNLFPNPANGVLNLENATGADLHIELTDITGKRVLRHQVGMGTERLDVNNLAPGMYLYRISGDNAGAARTGKLLLNL
jgi:hypothetical protein